MSIGTVIVITSGKGGTGKTSTAAGLAACLAAMGHKTLCLTEMWACGIWT